LWLGFQFMGRETMSKKEDLINRLKYVISAHCNTHGCKTCNLHIDYETNLCEATSLRNELDDIEMNEWKGSNE